MCSQQVHVQILFVKTNGTAYRLGAAKTYERCYLLYVTTSSPGYVLQNEHNESGFVGHGYLYYVLLQWFL
jgi:hypothetical protein